MSEQREKAPAGWYPHPSMADTQRYWDGQKWTDQVVPAATTPQRAEGMNYGKVFLAVLVAILVAALLAWFVADMVASGNEADCLIENLDRARDGRPALNCD